MKDLLSYRESDYFNNEDYYLFYSNLNLLYVTQLHYYNGSWYSNVGVKYKMTSVLCINLNELYHKEVEYIGTPLVGIITKYLEPKYIGVLWKQGQEYRKYGLPSFWCDTKKIIIKKD